MVQDKDIAAIED